MDGRDDDDDVAYSQSEFVRADLFLGSLLKKYKMSSKFPGILDLGYSTRMTHCLMTQNFKIVC